ncbi:MAG: hypothetical protein HKN87_22380 [Saprospiraceae bacterium]|nr:hypothetical protein [Saprospiraceae bacterium]
MIGILIALQINNWNERRKERILEREIITEIKNTIELNSKLLTDHISVIEGLNSRSDNIIALPNNDGEYDSTYEDDFYYCFYSGTNIYLLSDGYEGLKNTGFEIVQNVALRKSIINLFGIRYVQNAEFINFIKERSRYMSQS